MAISLMKRKLQLIACIILIQLSILACDKQNDPTFDTEEKPQISYADSLLNLSDSCAFNINGIHYISSSISQKGLGNEFVNFRLDSIAENGVAHYGGSKDSTMITRSCMYVSDWGAAEFKFLNIYKNEDLIIDKQSGNFFIPKADTAFFQLGRLGFPYNYSRINDKDGVAIKILLLESESIYKTHTSKTIDNTTLLNENSQANAIFNITKFEIIPGAYFVEGKFTANIFGQQENTTDSLRMNDGYFRCKFVF